jgi:hypothetical protein
MFSSGAAKFFAIKIPHPIFLIYPLTTPAYCVIIITYNIYMFYMIDRRASGMGGLFFLKLLRRNFRNGRMCPCTAQAADHKKINDEEEFFL